MIVEPHAHVTLGQSIEQGFVPKSCEEATIPDLSETVRPRARISLATYSTDWSRTRRTVAPRSLNLVRDIVNKLCQLNWEEPVNMVEKAMQKSPGKVTCKSTSLQIGIRRVNRFRD